MTGDHNGDIAEISRHGYQLLRENKIDEAELYFRQVLEKEPANCYAHVGLGDAARKRHDYQAAVDYYERCLESDADNTYALFGLADSHKSMKHYTEAIRAWERYLLQDDTNVTVLTRVADVYRKTKSHDRSRDLYLKVLELETDNPYALIGLGHLHYDFKEYEEALDYWKRMQEIDGAKVDIRVITSIGNCYRKLKRFADGVPYFEDARTREPNNFYALFGLADCYRGMNEPDRSLQFWNQILEADPTNKVILTRAGDAHRVMGELERAEACYQKALSIEFDVYAILGIALINRHRGEPEEAARSLTALLEREPRNPRVSQELAQAYLQMDRPDDALQVLIDFKKTGIHNSYVDELLARIEGS
jgi:tetratricopeptide (TPR) repeat protein